MQESLIKTAVQQFGQHLHKSAVEFGKACKIYADAVKVGGQIAHDQFASAFPHLTATAWNRFRLCGDGHVIPEVVMGATDHSFAMMCKLPIEKQRELISEYVDVVFVREKKPVIIKIKATEMTKEDIKKAITKTGDRILAAKQIEAIGYREPKPPYKIEGKRLVVFPGQGHVFSLEVLELIVLNMRG